MLQLHRQNIIFTGHASGCRVSIYSMLFLNRFPCHRIVFVFLSQDLDVVTRKQGPCPWAHSMMPLAQCEIREREARGGRDWEGWQVGQVWTCISTCWEHIFLILQKPQIQTNLFPSPDLMHFLLKNISLGKPLTHYPSTKEWTGPGKAKFPESHECAGDGENVIAFIPCRNMKGLPWNQNFPFALNKVTFWNTWPAAETVISCWV